MLQQCPKYLTVSRLCLVFCHLASSILVCKNVVQSWMKFCVKKTYVTYWKDQLRCVRYRLMYSKYTIIWDVNLTKIARTFAFKLFFNRISDPLKMLYLYRPGASTITKFWLDDLVWANKLHSSLIIGSFLCSLQPVLLAASLTLILSILPHSLASDLER